MASIDNENEKIEPMESKDPSVTAETDDLNYVSLDKQGSENIPEKDDLDTLTDEISEQPMDRAEPEDSQSTEETGESALANEVEEAIPADEPEAATEEEEVESVPDEPEESSVNIDISEEAIPVDEPEAAAEEEVIETLFDQSGDTPVESDAPNEPESLEEPASISEDDEPAAPSDDSEDVAEEIGTEDSVLEKDQSEAIRDESDDAVEVDEVLEDTEEADKRNEDGNAIPEDISIPGKEMGIIVDAAETLSDDTVPIKKNTELEADKPAKPESASVQSPPSRSITTHSSILPTASLILGLLAVVGVVAAGLYSQMLRVELDSLRNQVETTAQAPIAVPVESISGELDQLNKRIEELGARFEESGQSVKFTEEDWNTVKARLEKAEQSINSMRMRQKTAVPTPTQTIGAKTPKFVKTVPTPAARKGDWAVNLEAHRNENDADRALESLRSKGLPVEKFSVKSGGMTWYRLRVNGFSNAEEAKGYIKTTASRNGFPYAWIGQIQ